MADRQQLRVLYAAAHDAVCYGTAPGDDGTYLDDSKILELAADFFRVAGPDPDFLND